MNTNASPRTMRRLDHMMVCDFLTDFRYPASGLDYQGHRDIMSRRVTNAVAWHKTGCDTTACSEAEGTHKVKASNHGGQQGDGCKVLPLCDLNAIYSDIQAELDAEARRKPRVLCTVPDLSDDDNDYGCP